MDGDQASLRSMRYSRFFKSMLTFHDSDYTLRPFEFIPFDHIEPTDNILESVPVLWIAWLRHYGV